MANDADGHADAGLGMFLARLLLSLVVGVMAVIAARAKHTQRMVPLAEWTWQEMG